MQKQTHKKTILDLLKQQTHMVLATTNKQENPQAALVGFGEAEDLSLIFGTDKTTRKYQNIQHNPHVACVIGYDEKISVQYEGTVSLFEEEELKKYKQYYFTKTPSSKKYETYENQIYLKITPTWIRYTNYNQPKQIFEITF